MRERATPTKSPGMDAVLQKEGFFFFLSSIANFVWVAPTNHTSKRNILAQITVFPV